MASELARLKELLAGRPQASAAAPADAQARCQPRAGADGAAAGPLGPQMQLQGGDAAGPSTAAGPRQASAAGAPAAPPGMHVRGDAATAMHGAWQEPEEQQHAEEQQHMVQVTLRQAAAKAMANAMQEQVAQLEKRSAQLKQELWQLNGTMDVAAALQVGVLDVCAKCAMRVDAC